MIKFNFCFLFILMYAFISNDLLCQNNKADLIITNAELKYERPDRIYKPGQPVSGSDNIPRPVIYLTIKNIGSREITDPFYLMYTNIESDISEGRYSRFNLISPGDFPLGINESMVTKVGVSDHGSSHYKFCLQHDIKNYTNHMPSPVEEENYDNNTYECTLNGFK